MFLGAAGFFAFSTFLLFRTDPEQTRIFKQSGFTAFNWIYLGILIPSALWTPLALVMLEQPSTTLWLLIRAVLALTGVASLILLVALLTLQPRQSGWSYHLAVLGAVFFCLQTCLLDALVWPMVFPVLQTCNFNHMKLYFTRHGESLANTLHIISNRDLPHPLTEKGREQAAVLATRLTDKGITRIYTSPVPRATETALIAGGILSLPVTATDTLREYDCGVLEGRGDEEAWAIHQQFMRDWLAGRRRDQCPPGGETFEDIRDRFVPFIEFLVRDYGTRDENLLLVTHGGMLLLGLPHVLTNIDFAKARSLPLDNTLVIATEPSQGRLICLTWGDLVLA
jgi:probable phosphoglycerate mutase